MKTTGWNHLFQAIGYSLKGLIAALRYETAFRQELVIVIIGSIISGFLPFSASERLILIGSMLLVLIVELINSAIETVVDRIGEEFHPLSGRAKDMGSAAVFMALLFSLICWLTLLYVTIFS